jgi:hypothetical protein
MQEGTCIFPSGKQDEIMFYVIYRADTWVCPYRYKLLRLLLHFKYSYP